MRMRIGLPALIVVSMLYGMGCTTLAPRNETDAGQHHRSFKEEVRTTMEANYLLYLPDAYAATQEKWPLILFLHGAGERGGDLRQVEKHGPPKLIAEGDKAFPFVIVSPQCPRNEWWSSVTQIGTLNALLDHIVANYRIDENRIYVTGLSMGGFGTWRLACEYPHRFAAIAPICGGGDPFSTRAIGHLPVWVFHGAKDDVVPLKSSQEMVAALRQFGGNVAFTIYPDAGHDSWSESYGNPELYEWFLTHTRSGDR